MPDLDAVSADDPTLSPAVRWYSHAMMDLSHGPRMSLPAARPLPAFHGQHMSLPAARALPAVVIAAALFLGLEPTAVADDAKANGTIELGLSTYGAVGRGGAWIYASARGAMWFAERFSAGAYLDTAILGDPLEADCSNVYCAKSAYKVGAQARLHAFPSFVVDPWLGLGVGGHFDVGSRGTATGMHASASVGADVRLGRVAFGPFGFLEEPLVRSSLWQSESKWQGQLGFGIRADLLFD